MKSRLLLTSLILLLAAGTATAQMPTGTLTGLVTDGNAPLPGVTVTVTSPNMQGTRVAITEISGDYIFQFLPPGTYTVLFELAGFQSVGTSVKISGGQSTKLNAEMPMATVAEQITVTGALDTISTSNQVASTITQDILEALPLNRDIGAATTLVAGVNENGPGGNTVISGAQSYENLWLVNGVVVNENLRGQALPLFIEDAIQETTTSTANISAEYGRFAGGVVSALTKSGGNQFSGSFRTNFTNADWAEQRPGEAEPTDKINKVFEGTLGGFILKDHLWFFAAGRDRETTTSLQTSRTNVPYDRVAEERRYEAKLTFSPLPEHRLVGSYMEIDAATSNSSFSTIMDTRSLYDREDPQELFAVNYNAVITDNLFAEAQFSQRDYVISKGGGSPYSDRINGTLLLSQAHGNRRYWSPTFCAVCGPDETRNNENFLVKGSYFLTTEKLGAHDITFGYDLFKDKMFSENHQSGSDYRIYGTGAYIDRDPIVPIFNPSAGTRTTFFYYQPFLTPPQEGVIKTHSFYVNDKWRLLPNLTLNVGLRYDRNDGVDSGGSTIADDDRFSPRLGATWDVKGDGDLIVNMGLARYVMAVSNGSNVGDATSAAGLTGVYLYYGGPAINTNPNSLVSTEQALQQFFAWLDSVGGAFEWAKDPNHWKYSPDYPGLTPVILETLKSPYADEYSIGVSKRLGSKGVVRADYIHREFGSFYVEEITKRTGSVTNPAGISMDRAVLSNNDDDLERTYDGVQISGQYRVHDRFTTGGSYTWSQAMGNFIGETTNSGPVPADQLQYPEYRELSWNSPKGYLPIDQRHRARLWASWDAISSAHHRLNVGLLQFFDSGVPYEAVGTVDVEPYVQDEGYVAPTYEFNYFYSGRGAFRTPDIYRTDLSVNYAFKVPALGGNIELFLQPEILNVTNEQRAITVDTTVEDLQSFDPFTEKPVEGVHWRKEETFGKPLQPTHYQLPRTYRFSVGIRF